MSAPGQELPPPSPPEVAPPATQRLRQVTVVALIVALVLAVSGGAYAFYAIDPLHLFRSGPQAAEALPADAIFYAAVDLDPKAEQKVAALQFLDAFPGFRSGAKITDENTDIRQKLLAPAIRRLHCRDVRYADDVQPWLGQRMGFAVMPSTGETTDPVAFAIQASDEDAARRGIAALRSCGGTSAVSSDVGTAFVNGFLVLAETQQQASSYARAARAASLADDPRFIADRDALGDPGVLSLWFDVVGLVDAFRADLPPGLRLHDLAAGASRVAATLRFQSDSVELATAVYSRRAQPVPHAGNPVGGLPASTVFALSESGGAARVRLAWHDAMGSARAQRAAVQHQLQHFSAESGLRLPGDLETLFGSNLLLALDRQGIGSDALDRGDLSALSMGLRIAGDRQRLQDLYDRMSGLIRRTTGSGIPLVQHTSSDGLALATKREYAARLGRLDGDLGASDAFRSVVDDAEHQELVLFFDVDAVERPLLAAMRRDGVGPSTIANLRPLQAFGVTTVVDGHYQQMSMQLSVDG